MTGQFLRTLTTTGLVDEDWGKDAIEEIENVASKGHEGDTPEQPPFAKKKLFWMLAVNALGMGVVLGLASLVFINIIDEVPKVWSDVHTHGGYDFDEEENVGFNDGKVCALPFFALTFLLTDDIRHSLHDMTQTMGE